MEKERVETRIKSYQVTYAKAKEISRALSPKKTNNNQIEKDDIIFDDMMMRSINS